MGKTTRMTPSEVVHSVIERNIDSNQEKPQGFSKLILENKFVDLEWEILFDDTSSKTVDISQIRIKVKITYLNAATMKKSYLTLILNEAEFNELLLELSSLQKNF